MKSVSVIFRLSASATGRGRSSDAFLLNEVLTLQHFVNIFHPHQYLQRDDHQHQLSLINLIVQRVHQRYPYYHISHQNHNQEQNQQKHPLLQTIVQTRYYRIVQARHYLAHEKLSEFMLDYIYIFKRQLSYILKTCRPNLLFILLRLYSPCNSL